MTTCDNLKAIITGGSKGIGFAVARELASHGAELSICARGQAGLEHAAKELAEAGASVHTSAVDVGDGDALKRWVRESGERMGGIDIVVHNASPLVVMGEEGWTQNFSVDLMGGVRALDAALPFLERSGAASVVFIASVAATERFIGALPYSAMKAAVVTHANDLAFTLGPKGIRVNTVSPGPIIYEEGFWGGVRRDDPSLYEAMVARHPSGRLGTPEEVARCVRFVAGREGSHMTGTNLIVDGGFTARVS